MDDLTLVIGNKNYSSWSLRPWLAMRHAGIPGARARARAVASEMHVSFTALRNHMPMNLRRGDFKGKGRGPGVDQDITRICEIWRDCRACWGEGGAAGALDRG